MGVLGARGFPNTVSGSSTAEVTFLPTLLQTLTFSCCLLVFFSFKCSFIPLVIVVPFAFPLSARAVHAVVVSVSG